MRFIHTADIHLGAVPDKGKPWSDLRGQEIWKSFRRILGEAREQQVELLLIAGDLFHQPPSPRELREVNYLFGKLGRTQVVLIAGNHDYIDDESAIHGFEWSDNVVFLDSERCQCVHFEEWGVYVYGLSYHQREICAPLYDDLRPNGEPGCHILLAHGGDSTHVPIQRQKLASAGFDYIALGHIHKPQELVKNRMAYAGAPEPLDVNDTGAHGYILGEYRQGKISTRFVEAACREYVHLTLDCSAQDTDFSIREKLEECIQSRGAQNIYRVTVAGYRSPEVRLRPESWLSAGNIYDIEDETSPDYDLQELYQMHKGDIIGRYLERLLGDGQGDGRGGQADGRDSQSDYKDCQTVSGDDLTRQRRVRAAYYGVHALTKKRT